MLKKVDRKKENRNYNIIVVIATHHKKFKRETHLKVHFTPVIVIGAEKIVHNNRVFTINVLNFNIN